MYVFMSRWLFSGSEFQAFIILRKTRICSLFCGVDVIEGIVGEMPSVTQNRLKYDPDGQGSYNTHVAHIDYC